MAVIQTPGVFVNEINLPQQIVQTDTAVPVFIGYTQTVSGKNKSLLQTLCEISSLREYELLFGGAPLEHLSINKITTNDPDLILLNSNNYKLTSSADRYLLYRSLQLYFGNGGKVCYILSVGNYQNKISVFDILAGLEILKNDLASTLICIPDMISLHEKEYNAVAQKMLTIAASQNKFAILDVWQGNANDIIKADQAIGSFRNGIGNSNLIYGAAYFPWLKTFVIQPGEITFMNFDDLSIFIEPAAIKIWTNALALKNKKTTDKDITEILKTHQALLSSSTNYKTIINAAINQLNILPAVGAIAGVYSFVDSAFGVWKAPANQALNEVLSPTINLNDVQQTKLNDDTGTGKSINAIRSFAGKGVLVWGARTIQGNNNDFKYISVRRTISMMQRSITYGMQQFIFDPNEQKTWVAIKQLVENFMRTLWMQGALFGAKPEEAYFINIGQNTMTATDIANGQLIIEIGVAMLRPAEFIIIRIQQMQKHN